MPITNQFLKHNKSAKYKKNCNNRCDSLTEEDTKVENNEHERERKKAEEWISSDTEEHDECDKEDKSHWQEKFFQLRKMQN